MAAGSRTLKLTILGDVDNLKKSLTQANSDVESTTSKLGDFSKKAGLAFAAAGVAAAAYAGKLLVDGVKSAIADEAAQSKLATTLQNVTGATAAQIKATEDYITKTQLAYGVTDADLRPSLDRLVRSTKDVEEAQKLQSLALNIAAGTGKDLASVSEALAKAHDGNFGALKRLGVSIDDNIIKSKDFNAATAALSSTFEGQATKQAETFQGKMARLSEAFAEAKETVGSYVLDALTPLLSGFVNKGIPAIVSFAASLKETLGPAFTAIFAIIKNDLLPIITSWWSFIKDTIVPTFIAVVKPIFDGLSNAFNSIKKAISDNSDELGPFFSLLKGIANFVRDVLAPVLGGAFKVALTVIGGLVSGLISGFASLVGLINGVVSAITSLVNLVKNNAIVKGISGLIDSVFGGGRAVGGPVGSGTSYLVGERGPEIFTPNSNGFITPNNRLGRSNGNTFNITVNGAIDSEGTARQIINVLNNSFYRGTGGATALVS
jgi:hypothetical protein